MKLAGSPALAVASRLLFMPDLLNYWLTGVAPIELTIASTSQFYDPRREELGHGAAGSGWDCRRRSCPRLSRPADARNVAAAGGGTAGLARSRFMPPACHDTASAVAAVPAEGGDDWCYISSGTWSLMGLELDAPVIDADSLALNFTNEVGAAGKIRLLKNIAGLWLLQECRRAWVAEGAEFELRGTGADGGGSRPVTRHHRSRCVSGAGRDAAQDRGLLPPDRPAPPQTHGEFARTILESLALRYR